jgi:hypothetical protein
VAVPAFGLSAGRALGSVDPRAATLLDARTRDTLELFPVENRFGCLAQCLKERLRSLVGCTGGVEPHRRLTFREGIGKALAETQFPASNRARAAAAFRPAAGRRSEDGSQFPFSTAFHFELPFRMGKRILRGSSEGMSMSNACNRLPSILAALSGALLLSGCDVDVHDKGQDKNVDVRTAVGNFSVHTNEGGEQTGLPMYPGAEPLHEDGKEASSANISASSSVFGIHLVAAKFRSNDAPPAIVAFYKDKMSAYGTVMECRGDVDFDDQSKRPVCKEDSAGSEIQLVAGTEPSHRLVSVKPRGNGSEFALVSIQIDERS